MRRRRFLLKPFPGEGNPAGLTIGGSIGRRADTLSVLCEVRGNLSMVRIPAAADAPRRQDRLWEETCLELFLGTEDSGEYWELNLSPAGHWNVYRFTGYREGMREEAAITSLPFEVRRDPEVLLLSAEVGVGGIAPAGQDLAATVAAVIGTTDGGKSHWAPVHPASRPDFHRRDGFAFTLPATGACVRSSGFSRRRRR
ncbi:MAG: DOMON-like domain-containing protein [Deltaproteobacteria bacterium]|nr:DOMON-like domain-containing protein [Deltaproteobacteria bacterium]